MSTGAATISSARAAGTRFFWSLLVPGTATLFTIRYLLPPPMEGRANGAVALVGRLADEYLLAVGVGLFIALSAGVAYWRQHLGNGEARPARWSLDRRSVARLAGMLVAAVVAALFVRTSFFETYRVVSGSMVPTIATGDRVLVNKLAYGFKLPFTEHRLGARLPQRGDVVLIQATGNLAYERLPTESLVKRVIGLPGDRMSFEGDGLLINGRPVSFCDAGPYVTVMGKQTVRGRLALESLGDQKYLTLRPVGSPPSRSFLVPPGQVFVVGDDRADSSDSRNWNGGRGLGVPVTAIVGRVTRLVAGPRGEDGRLDLSRLFTKLSPHVHQPGVDLSRTDTWVRECLQKRPATTTPPAANAQRVPQPPVP